jgi:hypothetical protein
MEDFAKLLAARLAAQGTEAGAHPDADLLTAFAETRLRVSERKQVVAHLMACAQCREVVALVLGSASAAPAAKQSRLGWLDLRWAAALAAACVVGLVVWNPADERRAKAVAQQVSQVQSAPKVETVPVEKEQGAVAVLRPKEKRAAVAKAAVVPNPTPAAIAFSAPEVVDEIPKADQAVPARDAGMGFAVPQASPPVQGMAVRGKVRMFASAIAGSVHRQSLWNIAPSDGEVQRSDDGGKTWVPVPVEGGAHFLALSVAGNDIWAGGEGGALFHSIDGGAHWAEVTVMDGEERLRDAITGIETESSLVVRVRTKGGGFISDDGGVHWRKNS